MMHKVILIIGLLFSGLILSQTRKEVGQKFIQNLFTENFEACQSSFSPKVISQISTSLLTQVKGMIENQNGKFTDILQSTEIEEAPYYSLFYNIKFESKTAALKIVFDENDKIMGFFNSSYPGEEKLRPQTPQPPFLYNTEEVTVHNLKDGNSLAGSLTTPYQHSKNTPIAILITGSGAQNRNEELFEHQPFWVIADDFAKKGIATLRMDDRGVGKSSAGKSTDTTLNFAGDISSAVDYLKKRGYNNIGLVGHSEGGIIAAIVASKHPEIKFVVSLAGPGVTIKDLMMKQNENVLKSMISDETKLKADLSMKDKLFSYIKNYKGKSIQHDFNLYINQLYPNLSKEEKEAYQEITNDWWVYFLQMEPANYWKNVKAPILALNGSLDVQVDADDNLKAIENAARSSHNTKVTVHKIPQLNHLFQTAKTGNVQEYEQIEETISPTVLKIMSEWILKLKL